jgi:hypothetical protein
MSKADFWDIIGFLFGCLLLFVIMYGYLDGNYRNNPWLYSTLFVISLIVYAIASKMVDSEKINDDNLNND